MVQNLPGTFAFSNFYVFQSEQLSLVFFTKTLALLQLPNREGGDNDMEKKQRQRDIERERHAQRRRHR